VFPELSSLLTKTTGIAGVIREALAALAPRVRIAAVYGSAARNELRQGSDIDLLVVGDVDFDEVVSATRGVEKRLGREVNPSVYPVAEFARKVGEGHHFLTTVLSEPLVVVLGDRDELEGLGGAQQVADRAPHVEAGDRGDPRRRRSKPVGQPRKRPQR
jgi:predicted nucleotidyltransferase